ncbi:d4bad0f5-b61c-42d7-94dc-d939106025be [Thermothielavioides terrestris]|jgi:hypothetical protein|uniref:C3H1-type domain-containing protein n=2 Tax=Thermothielavioides terrestris TaxID=2587410 RepID=G2R8S4_THETT|nr:uncharacterized protein THITE_2117749 [Thermothielavioides terrestris NRRL 8126]AEO68290.1 hypothetical protein THITE_2117749 [Thermothielavioides terrestris NRRL 8126]SPQ24452.1 d4bad0f5-b61c-42d7-94dc-d939106025be [Thermothielavioides terrestris]
MLSDQEIERAEAQLAEYKRSDALSRLLEQYAVLIEDYKRLKSDYEEEREAREKYKQLARDQERNPFVLLLVDGDGYVFNDTLLAKRADGGSAAAQLLHEEVKASLRRKGLEHCQVMVRIYANVFGLSKTLSKTGVVGADSRSLAPFIASFNRSYGLTDFVDAGQLKENADFKLRALLRLYANNAQCKHIYFAACHDVGYISELIPFTANSSKFTLVNSPGIRFHDEFTKLGMGIEEFRSVFRHAPLEGNSQYRPPNIGVASSNAISAVPQPASPNKQPAPQNPASAIDDQRPVCLFYSLGRCRYGKSCKMLHLNPPADGASAASQADEPPPTWSNPVDGLLDAAEKLDKLPAKWEIPLGCVAVNKNNYRLDPRLAPVSADVIGRLKARVDKRRVCNSFHLQGSCDSGDRCEYDHEPLEPEFLPALESLARSQPCPRRGACRVEGCTHGHICQNPECKHRGGKAYCKIPYHAHLEDYKAYDFPASISKPRRKPANDSNESNSE